MSSVNLKRITKETIINVTVDIQGTGESSIDTGIGFLNHMLEAFAKHSSIDMVIKAEGDIEVDFHHTTEDIGIVLGSAIRKSLEKKNFARYGQSIIPMDEALILSSIDICNRSYLNFDCNLYGTIGNFDSELIEEFFRAFANNARVTLHIKQMYGSNKHHIAEAIFKSVAHSLKDAVRLTDKTLSTKGSL